MFGGIDTCMDLYTYTNMTTYEYQLTIAFKPSNLDPNATVCSAKWIFKPSGRDCMISRAPVIALRISLVTDLMLSRDIYFK